MISWLLISPRAAILTRILQLFLVEQGSFFLMLQQIAWLIPIVLLWFGTELQREMTVPESSKGKCPIPNYFYISNNVSINLHVSAFLCSIQRHTILKSPPTNLPRTLNIVSPGSCKRVRKTWYIHLPNPITAEMWTWKKCSAFYFWQMYPFYSPFVIVLFILFSFVISGQSCWFVAVRIIKKSFKILWNYNIIFN